MTPLPRRQLHLDDVAPVLVVDGGGSNACLRHQIVPNAGELGPERGDRTCPRQVEAECLVGGVVAITLERVDGHEPGPCIGEAALRSLNSRSMAYGSARLGS